MHRTEGTNHVSNMFENGPPGTYLEENWHNSVQEELAYVIEQGGITLKTAATDTRDQLKAALDALYQSVAIDDVAVGTMAAFPMSTPPTGWLELDGSAINKGTYVNLYTALKDGGATCIYGEAGANFSLPDLRGRFPRGWDHGAGTDPDAGTRTDRGDGQAGDYVGTKQAMKIGYHNHQQASATMVHEFPPGTLGIGGGVTAQDSDSYTFYYGSAGDESRPVNINVMWCIKY